MNQYKFFLVFFLWFISFTISAQTNALTDSFFRVAQRFEQQLALFPQEKIHLHTDKYYYISGERIWFRAHVVDAASHVPVFTSGSVFVELFDVRDSVVNRVKTGVANDFYSGYINIPDDVPEGDYTLRAYTNRMRGLDEDYFFMKNIHIGDPMSRVIQTQTEFEFLTNKKIGADIRFLRIRPLGSITPESVKISINDDKPMNLKCENGISGFSFNLPNTEKQRVMLLDIVHEEKLFRQYIKIPIADDDFDVSFYPEGGAAMAGYAGRTAFKAMQRDGTEINVAGIVYDQRGNEVTHFKTDLRGMGLITMKSERGDRYYAVCTNEKGQSKRFDLPVAQEYGYALTANWSKDRLLVQVCQPEYQKTADTLCLLIHTRGVVQDVRILEKTDMPLAFPKEFFPSGVSHLLLLTKDMIPVSERLVFVNNEKDHAKVEGVTDKDSYFARSPVAYTIQITDELGEPLWGNFSVSVTDNFVVTADTTASILTSLLLSSDLRGNIPDPAYFFRKKNNMSVFALDLLMLTQGWRRYDTERILRNDFIYLNTLHENGHEISGTVRYIVTRNPVENAGVSVISVSGDFATETFTDRNGRFYLYDGEIADSTKLIVQTAPQFGRRNLELILDKSSYPEKTIPVVASSAPDRDHFAQYADIVEQQYIEEHGMRIYYLSEVTITASKKQAVDYSFFYKAKDVSFVITEEEIEKYPAATMSSLLMRIPGVWISSEGSIFHGSSKVTVLLDGFSSSLVGIDPKDVAQLDFLRESNAAIFTGGIDGKVIAIYTKRGKPSRLLQKTPNVKPFIPLGIQKPAYFYAPKYDTPTQKTKPDLRTTIHWQPSITTNEEGMATFSFYTADTPSTYTVVIEGMTADGKIVYQKDKIIVNN